MTKNDYGLNINKEDSPTKKKDDIEQKRICYFFAKNKVGHL